MMRRLTVGLVCALLIAIAAGWAGVRADDPPLALLLEADGGVCTAGSLTEVRWEIVGGVAPYEVVLNGEVVDAASGRATVVCVSPYEVPDWLRGIVPLPLVEVEMAVVDAAGETVQEELGLRAAPAFRVPRLALYTGFGADWTLTLPTALRVYVERFDEAANPERRYVIRWREIGAAGWEYDVFRKPDSSNERHGDWQHDTGMTGVRFEVQVARVRSLAERAMPELLNWSDSGYDTTGSGPLDLTVRATHDTIDLSWGPAAEGLVWEVTVDHTREWRRSGWQWETKRPGPDLPYRANYDGLLPDTLYSVLVRPGIGSSIDAPSASLRVRTAPAPAGWSRAARLPQNVTVDVRDGNVVVAWEPPAEGPEREYEVFAQEYGTPRLEPVRVGAGERRAVVRNRRPDTTYEVIVRHLGVEDADARVVWEPPRETRRDWGPTMMLPAWHVRYQYPLFGEHCLGYKFAVIWGMQHKGELVQVRWRKDGYAMTQSALYPQILICMAEPGPHSFQLRLRNESGTWSQWSPPLRVTAKPPPPRFVDVRERDGMLVASWAPPAMWYDKSHLDDRIDGFRVYVYRAGEPDRMLDVGLATSAAFPIDAGEGEYEVHVASYSDELGESRASVHMFSRADGPKLGLSRGRYMYGGALCDPYAEIPTPVEWYIEGGAAPYTVRIAGNQTFETSDGEGIVGVMCDTEWEEDAGRLGVTVTDAHGRSDSAVIDYAMIESRTHFCEPEVIYNIWCLQTEGMALGRIYVRSDAFILRWNRYVDDWEARLARFMRSFVVRWRETGAETWRYRVMEDVGANTCREVSSRWTLDGLTPSTEYEVQIASYWEADELAQPERLEWTESRTGRTLPASIDVSVVRHGADIVVSWASIAEARDYVVTLRGDGVGWWKAYQPQGGAVEEAVFVDVPVELTAGLRAKVTTEQGISADPGGPEIEDYAYCD